MSTAILSPAITKALEIAQSEEKASRKARKEAYKQHLIKALECATTGPVDMSLIDHAEFMDQLESHPTRFFVEESLYDLFQKHCTQSRIFYSKKKISNGNLILLNNPKDEDEVTRFLALVSGMENPTIPRWAPGTLVQGKEKGYARSYYEVIADNGNAILVIFRFLSDKRGLMFPSHSEVACIRTKEQFAEATDMELPKSNLYLELPENWVKDFKKILIRHNDNPSVKVEVYVSLDY